MLKLGSFRKQLLNVIALPVRGPDRVGAVPLPWTENGRGAIYEKVMNNNKNNTPIAREANSGMMAQRSKMRVRSRTQRKLDQCMFRISKEVYQVKKKVEACHSVVPFS
jgi:hypothetical protein